MNALRSLLSKLFDRPEVQPPVRPQPTIEASAFPHIVFNGQVLTKEDLDRLKSSIIVESPPPEPPKLTPPRHALKLLGYWAYPQHWELTADPEEPAWPDIRRMVQPGWRVGERQQIVTYLRQGRLYQGYCGFSSCRFGCRGTFSLLGSGELTDGEWVWPEGFAHYVERHGVVLPTQFVASACDLNWTVPPQDEVLAKVPSTRLFYTRSQEEWEQLFEELLQHEPQQVNPAFWLEWAKSFPTVTPSLPDPYAMQRFRLVLQGPDLDEPDYPMEAFDTEVWDKVQRQFGQQVPNIGNEECIDSILVEHRDTVVAMVIDGLHQHQLEDRCRLLYGEPDPNDWQRDRDVVVWPK